MAIKLASWWTLGTPTLIPMVFSTTFPSTYSKCNSGHTLQTNPSLKVHHISFLERGPDDQHFKANCHIVRPNFSCELNNLKLVFFYIIIQHYSTTWVGSSSLEHVNYIMWRFSHKVRIHVYYPYIQTDILKFWMGLYSRKKSHETFFIPVLFIECTIN